MKIVIPVSRDIDAELRVLFEKTADRLCELEQKHHEIDEGVFREIAADWLGHDFIEFYNEWMEE